MKIAIGCDSGALALKEALVSRLEAQGHTVQDCITATAAAEAVGAGVCQRGIVLGATGVSESIAANKVNGVRCALLSDEVSARMTREHNDTNMMALGCGIVGQLLVFGIVDVWLKTEFSGGERHQRRVDKIMALEIG